MLLNLLAKSENPYRMATFSEAALYALLGFLVVFVGISFLILVIWLVGKVINRNTSRKTVVVAPKETKPISSQEEEIDEETLAVIMAALMAYYQNENAKCEFRVKRIKRI